MPMSADFQVKLLPILPEVVAHFGTPFHIYDEKGIRQGAQKLLETFCKVSLGFTNFYAVKANPNPAILEILHGEGFGFDCSSTPELELARQIGAKSAHIMFTSNNTALDEFECAQRNGGCILNLDDLSLVAEVPEPFPALISFRYNPGIRR